MLVLLQKKVTRRKYTGTGKTVSIFFGRGNTGEEGRETAVLSKASWCYRIRDAVTPITGNAPGANNAANVSLSWLVESH
jgi:hypothetical protein